MCCYFQTSSDDNFQVIVTSGAISLQQHNITVDHFHPHLYVNEFISRPVDYTSGNETVSICKLKRIFLTPAIITEVFLEVDSWDLFTVRPAGESVVNKFGK